ncbi:GntR family transcriptional regulator [Jiangella asiatica]|uniref:GntR family transcriptional regulator n=1 Tax=Jiangella asiatica TaxID=2530372 RepID=UPI0023B15778|nr:GntR family transcriptional regulator [Jiangella asiatica]
MDRVYLSLRDAIVVGELAPRTRLRENELAEHYSLSSTPVREALRRLAFEGLVELLPRRGAIVAEPDLSTIADLYTTRALMECAAVKLAAAATDRDLTRVEAVLAEEEAAVKATDHRAFSILDVAFHRALSDLGGNVVLAREAERLHRQIQAARSRAAVHLRDRLARSHAEHLEIVRAVSDGDPRRAQRLVGAHIAGVKETVLRALDTEKTTTLGSAVSQ